MSRSYIEAWVDCYTGRYLAELEREKGETSGYRPFPVCHRAQHHPRSMYLQPSAFTPFDQFLLRHQHCRAFHMTGTTVFRRTELPEMLVTGWFNDDKTLIIQQGQCPFEDNIAVWTSSEYHPLTFKYTDDNAFEAKGHKTISMRTKDGELRLLGSIESTSAHVLYDMGLDIQRRVTYFRGVMMNRSLAKPLVNTYIKIVWADTDNENVIEWTSRVYDITDDPTRVIDAEVLII